MGDFRNETLEILKADEDMVVIYYERIFATALMKLVTNGKPGYTWENIKPIIHLSLIVMSIGRNAIRLSMCVL